MPVHCCSQPTEHADAVIGAPMKHAVPEAGAPIPIRLDVSYSFFI